MFRERVAQFGDSSGAVVGEAVHQKCGTAGAIPLVQHAHELGVDAAFGGRLAHGLVNGIPGKAQGASAIHGHPQARVGTRIRAPYTGGDRDFADELAKNLAPPFALCGEAPLDADPFAMTWH